MNRVAATARRLIPKRLKKHLRKLYDGAVDSFDAGERRRKMIPPRAMRSFVGGGDYEAIGIEFRRLFIEYGGLTPEDRVLDVGCGIGRMAVPLTGYLSPRALYEGFDIAREGIEWCQKNITSRYPTFRFQHSDVWNGLYNPKGASESSKYVFPYKDGSFDFVFLTSVFTHMFPRDLEHYLEEIARVLKKGGRCFITFFLMNEESQALIREKKSTQGFVHEFGDCFITTPETPETAIAFPDPYIRDLFARFGLTLREPIHYGSWCGRTKFLSYQDVTIATK